MKTRLLIDLVLGFALQFFQGQQDYAAVDYVKKIVAIKTAGDEVDAYLQDIADYLLGGERPDFENLIGRVNKEVDELLGRDSGGPVPDTPESAPSEDGTTGDGGAAASASQPETGPNGEGGDTPAGPPPPE